MSIISLRRCISSPLPSRWLLDFSELDRGVPGKPRTLLVLLFGIGIARRPIGVNRPRRNTRPWRNNGDCSFLVNRGNSFRPQCIWDPYLERPSRVFPFVLFSFSLAYLRALRKNALTDPGCSHWPKPGSNSILFGLWTARWSIGQRSDRPLGWERETKRLAQDFSQHYVCFPFVFIFLWINTTDLNYLYHYLNTSKKMVNKDLQF